MSKNYLKSAFTVIRPQSAGLALFQSQVQKTISSDFLQERDKIKAALVLNEATLTDNSELLTKFKLQYNLLRSCVTRLDNGDESYRPEELSMARGYLEEYARNKIANQNNVWIRISREGCLSIVSSNKGEAENIAIIEYAESCLERQVLELNTIIANCQKEINELSKQLTEAEAKAQEFSPENATPGAVSVRSPSAGIV